MSELLESLNQLRYFYGRNIALNLHLMESHLKYQRFIVLGKGRSGSNFLRGLLNAHAQVVMFGELFRSANSIGWEFPDYDRYAQSKQAIALMQSNPASFLEGEVFKKFPKEILAVGFKLFYYHAQEGAQRSLWDFLQKDQEIKIIHLKRKNTLREILSLKKAFKTNEWTNSTGREAKKFSISLDFDELLQEFNYAQQIKQKYDDFFVDQPKIDVIYEDLADDYAREMRHVQAFLGVGAEPVQPSTFKQSNQPLSEAIINYTELKQQFSNTPWHSYFEE